MTHGQTHTQTDRQTDRQTQTDFIICPIAVCYSYGADKNKNTSAFWDTVYTNMCMSDSLTASQLWVKVSRSCRDREVYFLGECGVDHGNLFLGVEMRRSGSRLEVVSHHAIHVRQYLSKVDVI